MPTRRVHRWHQVGRLASGVVSVAPEPPASSGAVDPVPRELIAFAVVVTIAGLVLRFVTLSPLWLDEALSVNIASLPLGEIAGALRRDGHPPLYYWLLHGWIRVVGDSDVAVRALSGVFAVATLPLGFIAGRRRGGPLLGLLTVVVLALNPFALRYANEARMYSMVMVLVLVGYLLVDDVVRRHAVTPARLTGLAVVSGASLLTHYWSIWLLGALGVVLLVVWRRAPDDGVRRRAGITAAAVAAGALLFVPWIPTFVHQATRTGTPWAAPTRPTGVVGLTFLDYGGGSGTADPHLAALLLFLASFLGVFAVVLGPWRMAVDLRSTPQLRWEGAVVAGTFVVASAVAYLGRAAFASRYTAVVFPIVMVLVAGGLSRFTPRLALDVAVVVLVGSLLVGAAWVIITPRTQARLNADALAGRARPGDLVVYCPDQLGPAHHREVRSDLRQVSYPGFGDPRFVDWVDYAARNRSADPVAFAERAIAEAGDDHRIYVVWAGVYRTFENRCEQLIAELAARRGGANPLVADRGDRYFEHAAVVEIPAAMGP